MSVAEKDRIASRIKHYLFERLYTIHRQWEPDVISAVIASKNNDDLTDVMERIQKLQELKGAGRLAQSAKVIERTGNILKGASGQPTNGIDAAQLKEPLEQQLYTLYESKKDEFARLVEQKSYDTATTLFGETFYTPLHDFFDKVLVNVEDEALRRNRLALMRAIQTLYTERIADLSKLTLLQREEP
jgi:glycyl-tRNA synthetase beta chain